MHTTADPLSDYERNLAELRDACAALDDTLRMITDTAARLRAWPRESSDFLIDALPWDWPDPQRLVAVIARYGRAKDAALVAWCALPRPLRDNVAAPEQFLAAADGRGAPAPAAPMSAPCA